MPYKPKKPCRYPGCAELTNDTYCEKHKQKTMKYYDKYYRNQSSKEFYNSPEWQALRKQKLTLDPYCQECKKNGTIVKGVMIDHIVPIRDGGNPLDINNLQTLCWSCHSRKTMIETFHSNKEHKY